MTLEVTVLNPIIRPLGEAPLDEVKGPFLVKCSTSGCPVYGVFSVRQSRPKKWNVLIDPETGSELEEAWFCNQHCEKKPDDAAFPWRPKDYDTFRMVRHRKQ